jgi:hypothetical protein
VSAKGPRFRRAALKYNRQDGRSAAPRQSGSTGSVALCSGVQIRGRMGARSVSECAWQMHLSAKRQSAERRGRSRSKATRRSTIRSLKTCAPNIRRSQAMRFSIRVFRRSPTRFSRVPTNAPRLMPVFQPCCALPIGPISQKQNLQTSTSRFSAFQRILASPIDPAPVLAHAQFEIWSASALTSTSFAWRRLRIYRFPL